MIETNPAAVSSSAPSAPLDQDYGASMNAPRTALSADMQKEDMGGDAMDIEMHNEEEGHYGTYTVELQVKARRNPFDTQAWIQITTKKSSKPYNIYYLQLS